MSSLTSLSKAAVVAATATTTRLAVDHFSLFSSSEEQHDPYESELKWNMYIGAYKVVGMLIGAFLLSALLRCIDGPSNDDQQASSQPATRRICPLIIAMEPALNFTNGLKLAGGADHPECSVCLSEFAEGEEIRILSNCRHGFHLKCIETWLSSHSSCPTCRTNCVTTSVKTNDPPEHDLEAAVPPEIEMTVLQQHGQNDIDDVEDANLPELEIVVQQQQQQ